MDMVREEDVEAIVIRAIEDAAKKAVDMTEGKKCQDDVGNEVAVRLKQ